MIIFTFLFLALSAGAQHKVVYGEDNRQELIDVTNPEYLKYSEAIAAKLPNLYFRRVGKEVVLRYFPLSDKGICSEERFLTQNTVAMCTGFLIAPDLLATAGHCVKTLSDCKGASWAFGYKMRSSTETRFNLPAENVFSCKRIVAQSYGYPGSDYAVIQLNKKVPKRTPLRLRQEGTIEVNTPLVVLGHPSGLPLKVADGAQVRRLEAQWFLANLDTFAGNSGSPVISTLTGEVEGILVRGEDDYVEDSARGCKKVKTCADDGCLGEEVTYIRDILHLLP